MKLLLNGEEITLAEAAPGPTVSEFLEARGVRSEACAIEINRRLAPRRLHGEIRLQDGDRVEIVTLVGGG